MERKKQQEWEMQIRGGRGPPRAPVPQRMSIAPVAPLGGFPE